jgi:hypothetical protein
MLGSSRVLLDLSYLKSEVVPCFPETYNVMETFRSQYERALVVQISSLYQVGRRHTLHFNDAT